MTDYEIEAMDTVRDAVKTICNAGNAYGTDKAIAEGMLQAVTGQHPTLQQSFFRAVAELIRGYAEYEYIDGRNKASHAWAREVAELGGYFPLI